MKRTLGMILALGMILGLGVVPKADAALTNDQMTITITLNITADVTITTTTIKWNGGATTLNPTLDLGATDYFIQPATITVTTNYSAAEGVELDLNNVDGSGAWTNDTDSVIEADKYQIYALLSDVSRSTAPALTPTSDWDESTTVAVGDQVLDSTRRYGESSGDSANNGSQFQKNTLDLAAGDREDLNDGEKRHLWIRVDAPQVSSDLTDQKFSVVVTPTTAN